MKATLLSYVALCRVYMEVQPGFPPRRTVPWLSFPVLSDGRRTVMWLIPFTRRTDQFGQVHQLAVTYATSPK